jgi:hypothetical protein
MGGSPSGLADSSFLNSELHMVRMTNLFALTIATLFGFVLILPNPATATLVPLTSVKGWPNGRVSNDTPPNAIDGNTNTYSWTTESNNAVNPSFLGVGFNSSPVNRIRLWKLPDSGFGFTPNIKNLAIQYTNSNPATPLDLRTWQNVSGLTTGSGGNEPINASSINANGTVTGDVHNSSAGDGWASLRFDVVQATGMRIAFSVPSGSPINHYRVGEFQVHIPEPCAIALLLSGVVAWVASRRVRRG